jgi:hypothetical protein
VNKRFRWVLFLHFSALEKDWIALQYESDYDTKTMVLGEFAQWLNAEDIPDVVHFDKYLIRRSAIVKVDAERC